MIWIMQRTLAAVSLSSWVPISSSAPTCPASDRARPEGLSPDPSSAFADSASAWASLSYCSLAALLPRISQAPLSSCCSSALPYSPQIIVAMALLLV